MTPSGYRYHEEGSVGIPAPPADVFSFADDHRNLAQHMSARSGMMAGSALSTQIDETHGQAVGGHIRMSGRVMGVRVDLDEAVTERHVPTSKVWETIGEPRLIVIGRYAMGFDVAPEADGARMRVFIDYDPPARHPWLGRIFGRTYARWCVRQMTRDVRRHFVPVA